MWLICLACLFPFPAPQPGDVEGVKQAVESYYATQRSPWSEAAGPFAKVELHLLTPAAGSADVTLTWIDVSGSHSEKRRFAVARNSGEWRVAQMRE